MCFAVLYRLVCLLICGIVLFFLSFCFIPVVRAYAVIRSICVCNLVPKRSYCGQAPRYSKKVIYVDRADGQRVYSDRPYAMCEQCLDNVNIEKHIVRGRVCPADLTLCCRRISYVVEIPPSLVTLSDS
jgi:hypothetical protein